MSTSAPKTPTWAVTGQEPETTYDENGKPQQVMHTHFQTASGVKDKVTLPAALHTPENVAAQIHHAAGNIETVAKMDSTNAPPPETT